MTARQHAIELCLIRDRHDLASARHHCFSYHRHVVASPRVVFIFFEVHLAFELTSSLMFIHLYFSHLIAISFCTVAFRAVFGLHVQHLVLFGVELNGFDVVGFYYSRPISAADFTLVSDTSFGETLKPSFLAVDEVIFIRRPRFAVYFVQTARSPPAP